MRGDTPHELLCFSPSVHLPVLGGYGRLFPHVIAE